MAEIDYQKIFDYIDKSQADLKEDLTAFIKSEVRGELLDIKASIANMTTEVKEIREELVVSNHRHDRIEDWAAKVAPKVGVPLSL